MVKKSTEYDTAKNTYRLWLVGFIICMLMLVGYTIFGVIRVLSVQKSVLPVTRIDNSEFTYVSSTMIMPGINTPAHPVGVMIDNHFEAWDQQYGLSFAQVVYSTLVEGGTTRFLAFFDVNNIDTRIGPVRSVRPYFLPWIEEYDAMLVHVGGAPEALDDLVTFDITSLNEMSSYGPLYFDRDSLFLPPHNTFTSSQDLVQALEARDLLNIEHLSLTHFSYVLEPRQVVRTPQHIYIDYSARSTYDVEYSWEADNALYVRYRVGEVQKDAYNDSVIGIKNVVIQHVPTEIVLDDKLRIEMNVVGEGEAQFFADGRVVRGIWKKDDRKTPTRFFTSNGTEYSFSPGNIWIEVVPDGHEVTID